MHLQTTNEFLEAGDDDAVAQVADRAVDVLIELLEDKTLDLRPCTDADQQSTVLPCSPRKSHKSTTRAKGPSFSRMRPALLLFLVHHLWLTLKDTIPESSLNEAAGKMLGYMMAKEVDILGRNHGADEVHEYYANFCASVAISCDISDLDTFWTFGKVLTNEGQKRW